MEIHSKGLYGCASALLIILSSQASALTVSSDNRFVRVSGEVSSYNSVSSWNKQVYSPASGDSFNQELIESDSIANNAASTEAKIDSSIDSNGAQTTFTGSGSAYSYATREMETNPRYRYQRADGRSEFEITFSIDSTSTASCKYATYPSPLMAGLDKSI